MRKEKIIHIDKYVSRKKSIEKLTIERMAQDCNVSQSTISRYVRLKGFENFISFRQQLLENRNIKINKKKKNKRIDEKLANLEYALTEFKTFNLDYLKHFSTKKIVVFYETQYEHVGRLFINKMNLISGNFVIVRARSELLYIDKVTKGDWSFISIGNIPEMLYEKDKNYLEIINDEEYLFKENVRSIKLLGTKQEKKRNQFTSNKLAVHCILDLISEEYIKIHYTEEEIDIMLESFT